MNNFVTTKNSWDATLYQGKHSFVWQYSEDLLQLLNPQPGESILDLGCGTGQLTEKIAQTGAEVLGTDNSATMIKEARQNYPHLHFDVADARNFRVDKPLDVVFSNAVLHWVKEPEVAISSIHQVLKLGGHFVAEFGGKGNIQQILLALYRALETLCISNPETINPWYFPSIGEYVHILEKQGFDVIYAALFNRPTTLAEGKIAMANWIQMFASAFLVGLTPDQQVQLICEV